uniref:NADH-ubiquinone oxidoreductase chain 1 n=1 Tax=Acanthormius sp. QL-2013 TaxID=1421592 RepID=A0A0A6ZKS7_9HYME|nr:NADH dehydrogenase subunit 1 [Acanthormius sp. QL-2013]
MKQLNFYLMNNIMIMLIMFMIMMIGVAFLTLFERKILSYMHYRKGPNKISLMGLLQPFSDAMKLLNKEFFYPYKSNYYYYMLSPLLMLILSLSMWMIYPFMTNLYNWNYNSLFFLCLMSMGVYSLMISGWASNSSFAMLGSIRSISQSISYEVTFAISFLVSLMMINSLNIMKLMIYQKYLYFMFMLWPVSTIMIMSMLAEINRTPFDLSEGESELVSGFNIEYSNYGFTLIFLSEYSNIMLLMFLFDLMYLNFNMFNLMFYLNLLMLFSLIIWLRATMTRIRYDLLMYFGEIYMLPFKFIKLFYFTLLKYPMDYFLLNLKYKL